MDNKKSNNIVLYEALLKAKEEARNSKSNFENENKWKPVRVDYLKGGLIYEKIISRVNTK